MKEPAYPLRARNGGAGSPLTLAPQRRELWWFHRQRFCMDHGSGDLDTDNTEPWYEQTSYNERTTNRESLRKNAMALTTHEFCHQSALQDESIGVANAPFNTSNPPSVSLSSFQKLLLDHARDPNNSTNSTDDLY
ncbi:hypothetical protein HZ326_28449 [Fusarium oxysporum f. sp. albedinis]|nr:hypothetical protein HZ326_28449 [Fusarium oxysporum f. sp. albedinis]